MRGEKIEAGIKNKEFLILLVADYMNLKVYVKTFSRKADRICGFDL